MPNAAFRIKRDYGVLELKRSYGRNLIRGLACSLVLNLLTIGLYWGIIYLEPERAVPNASIRILKYRELVDVPSVANTQFGLPAYPVVASPLAEQPVQSRGISRVRPGPRTKPQIQSVAARGLGEIRGELPSAPGAKKIDPATLLADEQNTLDPQEYETEHQAGAGGNSDDRFRGGSLFAAKEGDLPLGNAHSGIGTNPHNIAGGEGNDGGGQGGDWNKFGSGLEGASGFSMNWLRGGTRRRLTGALPKYPPGVNVEATIGILAVVAPDGSVKSVQPASKANAKLEDAAMKELRFWKFERLRNSVPQHDQTCIVTFLFRLK